MRLALAFLCAAALLPAAVDGVVMNRTTGKPQPGVEVVLTTMGAGGMQPAGRAVSGPDGRFRIEAGTDSAHLLQAVWQGVSYNRSLQQGAAGVEIEIYDALPRVSAATIAQHMILVETDGTEIVVNETIVIQNDSLTTWNDPKGGVAQVYVPEAAGGEVRARIVAPGGLPVERQPRRAGPPNVWTLDAPAKPGETRIDFSYKLPAGEKSQLSTRILHGGKARLIVPDSISATGENLKLLGAEPSINAAIFEIEKPAFTVTLTGTGALRASTSRPAEAGDGSPRLQTIQPPGYQRSWIYVLALGGIILLLGFIAQYIKGAPGAGGDRRA